MWRLAPREHSHLLCHLRQMFLQRSKDLLTFSFPNSINCSECRIIRKMPATVLAAPKAMTTCQIRGRFRNERAPSQKNTAIDAVSTAAPTKFGSDAIVTRITPEIGVISTFVFWFRNPIPTSSQRTSQTPTAPAPYSPPDSATLAPHSKYACNVHPPTNSAPPKNAARM